MIAYVWTQLCHLVRVNGFYCCRHGKNIEQRCGGMARLWPFDRDARMKNWSDLRSRFPRRSPWSADSRSRCCRHTGSLAWGHIEHTSHHSIWHAGNIFATCRRIPWEGVEKRTGDHERSACYTRITTHVDARLWTKRGYVPSGNISRLVSVANYPSNNALRAPPQIADESSTHIIYTHRSTLIPRWKNIAAKSHLFGENRSAILVCKFAVMIVNRN